MPLIPDTYAELSSSFSTSNTVFTKALETAALPSGGKYLIIVNANTGNSSLNKNVDVRVTYNGSLLSGSESQRLATSSSDEERYSYFTLIETSVSTGTISLEVKNESSSGSILVKAATIICLDLQNLVSGSDYIFEETSLLEENKDSFITRESISIPASKKTNGQWLVLAQASMKYGTTGIEHHTRISYRGSDTQHECIKRIKEGQEKDVFYMQKIVGVPFIGYPAHLGGTPKDGSSKSLSIQTKDSESRPSNTVIENSKIFALRLASVQYSKHTVKTKQALEADGAFENVAVIENYNPVQDDALTTSAGSYRSGKTVGLAYAHFNPKTDDKVGQRIWMNIEYEGSDAVDNLKNHTIQATSFSDEMSDFGFAFIQDSESSQTNKTCAFKAKTYHPSSQSFDISLCLINLGSPVAEPSPAGRAVLEMNRIIRIR